VAKSRNGIGNVLNRMGKYEEALVEYHQALEAFLGNMANINYGNTANINYGQGQYDQALDVYKSVLETKIRVCSKEGPWVPRAHRPGTWTHRRGPTGTTMSSLASRQPRRMRRPRGRADGRCRHGVRFQAGDARAPSEWGAHESGHTHCRSVARARGIRRGCKSFSRMRQ
jgi:hypothetical protein